ncbi:hypothetical protein L9F63_006157, partial [Diploptera punctata]
LMFNMYLILDISTKLYSPQMKRMNNFKILFFVWFDMVLLHSTPFNIFMDLRA